MPSQLFANEAISFLACKPFTYRGTEYAMGDDFPQEEANNIETLVRSRYVIPVVEDIADKPRHWHGHIRTREQAMEYLNRERVQLRMPHEYDSEEVVALDVLTHPETTPEPTQEATTTKSGESEDRATPARSMTEPEAKGQPVTEPELRSIEDDPDDNPQEFDPGDYTVAEVRDYIALHPEQEERILSAEERGRGRKGLVEE